MKENIRVFIVDDSAVFRSQIRAALEGQPGIEVVGFANNGQMACDLIKGKDADVVTLDLEMPVMDGLKTLVEFRKMGINPYTIVFSAHTRTGAESTLAALQSGASDFLLKPQLDPNAKVTPAEVIREVLLPKIQQAKNKGTSIQSVDVKPVVPKRFPKMSFAGFNPKVVVIASSTGGPGALENLFSQIRLPISVPILIAQHMPPIFTAALAERLRKVSGIPVVEAKHREPALKGNVYIAPGDYHMKIAIESGEPVIHLDQEPLRNSVRPCANYLFESATAAFRHSVLGIVLTGMGEDGKDGALAIKKNNGGIFIQDKKSSIVFGMPGAVYSEEAYDLMTDVEGIARSLNELSICNLEKKGA